MTLKFLPSSVPVCSSVQVELELALLSQVTILDRSFLRDRAKFGIIGDEGRGSVGGVSHYLASVLGLNTF